MVSASAKEALANLLEDLFRDGSELKRFAYFWDAMDDHISLIHWDRALAYAVYEFVEVVEKKGINSSLFEKLIKKTPGRREEILQVQSLWAKDGEVAPQEISKSSTVPRTLIRRPVKGKGHVELEIHRVPGQEFGFGVNSYIRINSGRLELFTFNYSQELLGAITEIYTGTAQPETARTVGNKLREFLQAAGETVDSISGRVTLCTGADELKPLALEMSKGTQRPWLGLEDSVSIRYRVPGVKSKLFVENRGQVLLAWSEFVAPVSHEDHAEVIARTCPSWLSFDPSGERGVLAFTSVKALAARLDELGDVTVLQLLCHGQQYNDGTFGIGLDSGHVSPERLARVLKKYARHLCLVILCIHNFNEVEPGPSLGKFAEELHRVGIPWVVSSRGLLHETSSFALTKVVFTGLVDGFEAIDQVMTAARSALEYDGWHEYEWASLQLHVAPHSSGGTSYPEDTIVPLRGVMAATLTTHSVAVSVWLISSLIFIAHTTVVWSIDFVEESWLLQGSTLAVTGVLFAASTWKIFHSWRRCRSNLWSPYFTGEDEYGRWLDVRVGKSGLRFRWIPPGTFAMGSPNHEDGRVHYESQHKVTIKEGYWLADAPCTQSLWVEVMGENPSNYKGANRPVESISWFDIQAFIKRLNELLPGLGVRLPTEAEWEYGCRARTTASRYGELMEVAWHDRESDTGTANVKQKRANPWGLYDMLGNVHEWCQDRPSFDNVRVYRGGSWSSSAREVRSAFRSWTSPNSRTSYLGFRLARGSAVFSENNSVGNDVENPIEDLHGEESSEHEDGCVEVMGEWATVFGKMSVSIPEAFADRYVVREVLSQSAKHTVCRAEDGLLHRTLAIKFYEEEDTEMRLRQLREGETLAQIRHPNVVHMYDAGTYEGQFYMVMEYIDGWTLSGWSYKKKRTWKEIVEVYCQAGAGLLAIHQQGFVHRNFNPKNVLVERETGRACVADFGLVTRCKQHPVSRSRVLVAHDVNKECGTPLYMAPESLLGQYDPRSDQFSFCVSLYRDLYRNYPFTGQYKPLEFGDLVRAVDAGKIHRPRKTDVPRWVFRVLARGLQRDPEKRYPSMSELLKDLDPKRGLLRKFLF